VNIVRWRVRRLRLGLYEIRFDCDLVVVGSEREMLRPRDAVYIVARLEPDEY
jgi:hypothetical protein